MSIEYIVPQGGADVTIYLTLTSTANGNLATGLTNLDVSSYYLRPLDAAPTEISVASLAGPGSPHADGGFIEVSAVNMPGLYRFDLPDAAVASGENFVMVTVDSDTTARAYGIVNLDPLPSIVQGEVVTDANNSTSTFETNLSETSNDQYVDAFLLFRTGDNAGAVEKVTDYNGTNKFITTNAFPNTPTGGDEFVIVNR